MCPAALPETVCGNNRTCLKQTGPPEGLVAAALRRGQFFTKDEVLKMMAAAGVEKPRRVVAGKNKAPLKIDLVKALVAHHLPDLSEEEQADISETICQQRKKDKEVPDEVLEAVSQLDEENRKHFGDIKKDAQDQMERRRKQQLADAMKAGMARGRAAAAADVICHN